MLDQLSNFNQIFLKQTVSVKIEDNVRTVVIKRPVTWSHYNFTTKPGDMSIISAVGSSPELSYHKTRTGGKISLVPSQDNSCVCQPESKDFISYMGSSRQQFADYDCMDQPRLD